MANAAVVCPRCGETNSPRSQVCWVCDAALPAPAPHVPRSSSATKVILTIVVGIAVAIAIVPVLFLVTCFGIIALSSYH